MNVSKEMAASSQDFTNAKVFHDMFTNLFDNTRRLLTPLTQQNADVALQYCKVRTVQVWKIKFVGQSVNSIQTGLIFGLFKPLSINEGETYITNTDIFQLWQMLLSY